MNKLSKWPFDCDYFAVTQDSDCVTVDDVGMVTSSEDECDATVLITSVESFNINMSVVVQVLVSFF